ncbi:hypothetical protein NliqN6_3873 [Naganishia liquefaciens]|uniref:ATP12-domain-containing protein n=1 Tax=Naganishia liquefaciens TaxID=104408 RepID=A0A8H3TV24_9TREE|nr:hypothetical protein NliqN6_3873 [Naganishia liquefaciens]
MLTRPLGLVKAISPLAIPRTPARLPVLVRHASTARAPLLPDALKSVGAKVNESNRAEISLKRFWKTVGIMQQSDTTYWITLDGRPLRTPSGTRLAVPADRQILAMLIANEWENQKEALKAPGLPMTSLASRALDGFMGPERETTREGVLNELFRYLDTDTTLFAADHPSTLVRLQAEHWDPLHAWYKAEHGIDIKTYDTLVLGGGNKFKQSDETKRVLSDAVKGWDAWQIAALERATYTTKSFLIAFALVSGRLTADQAARAAQVEVSSQIELWGEVEDSHDVDYQDIRRQLGSVVCLLAKTA